METTEETKQKSALRRLIWIIPIAVGALVLGGGVVLAATHRASPQITETTFSAKVSSNAPLTIAFNQFMRPGSVRKAFSLNPEVAGVISWGLKTFTFTPNEPFQEGQSYVLTVSADAKNILGKSLIEPFVSEFTVVDPPKVLLSVPQGPAGVDSKVTVMFDRPMTALTTLDEGTPDLPIAIKPYVAGRYRWIGTSAIQFIPTERFDYATRYAVTIPQGITSLDQGMTTQEQVFEFETPQLAVEQTGMPHYPEEKLWIQFNQEVDLASVREYVRLYLFDEGRPPLPLTFSYGTKIEYEEKDGKQVEKTVENKKVIDIRLRSGNFDYTEEYWFEVKGGIMGKEGNIPSDSTRADYFATNGFIEYATPQCTGACADPKPHITFRFHEEVKLESVTTALTLTPNFAYTPAYGKTCDPEWHYNEAKPGEQCPPIDDKHVVEIVAREVLGNEQQYRVALNQIAIETMKGKAPYVMNDPDASRVYEWEVTTAAAPQIVGLWGGPAGRQSYKQFCLYSNNELNTEKLEEELRFSPEYTKKKRDGKSDIYFTVVKPLAQRPNWDRNYYCDDYGPADAWSTNVLVLLNPSTNYTITIPGTAEDVFGQRIGQDFVVENYVTEPMKNEDRSLISRQKDSFGVSTKTMNIPLVFETKNLDEVTLELCRLRPEDYVSVQTEQNRNTRAHYTEVGWRAFVPSPARCAWYTSKVVPIKHRFWEPAFVEVDIVKEAGGDFVNGLYYAQISSPYVYTFDQARFYSETERKWVNRETTKFITRPFGIVSFTDTHLALKEAADKLLVWATSLSEGQPKPGVDINFYDDRGSAVLNTRATDADGVVKYNADNFNIAYVVGKTARDAAVLRTSWQDGISNWDFNISSGGLVQGLQGYLYTERPIYRPGHTVYFKGLVRNEYDAHFSLPDAQTIEVFVTDSNGTEVYRKELSLSRSGTFDDSLVIDSSAPLGNWNINVARVCTASGNCAGMYASAYFAVEEYREPEYKTEVRFDKAEYVNRDRVQADITGSYYFGAPLRDATLNWSITSQNYYFDKYKGDDEWYSFSDSDYGYGCYGECPYEDFEPARGEALLNELGQARVEHEITLHKNNKGEDITPRTGKLYTLHATVVDENNRSVSNRETVVVHPGEFYVGVRNEAYVVKEGEQAYFSAITVDTQGKPLSGTSVTAELVYSEWKSIKKKNVDGIFYWENELQEEVLDTRRLSSNNEGKMSFNFKVPKGGSYRVRMKARDGRGNEIISSVGFWASSYSYINWRRENNNRMELELDKEEYRVGETAKLLVRSPYQNVKALLSIERGTILEYRVIDIASNAEVIELPVTEDMIPNVYASVMVVQKELADEPPDFKLGYASLRVNTQKKRLFMTLETDKEQYKPRETVRLTLKTENEARERVSAHVSLAVVDESVLALLGNPKKDLLGAFYNRHGLGVQNSSSLTKRIERAELSKEKGSKGGGGGGEQEFQYRGDFKATAHWQANVVTNKNGEATVEFKLPDNLTTWVIEAVGVTDNTLVGVDEKRFITTRDVIVRPVLPRFIRGGDTLLLGAIVHNFTDKAQTFEVTLETEELKNISRSKQEARIEPRESQKVMWEVSGKNATIGKKAVVRAKAVAGNYSDGVEIKLPIAPAITPESVATMNVTDAASFKERVVIPADIDTSRGSLKITAGATLATFLPESFKYLVQFPYGCSEQTMSTVIPMVALKRAMQLPHFEGKFTFPELYNEFDEPLSFDEVIEASLQRMYNSQRPDDGWGYWPESKRSYAYVTAYVLYGLDAIQKAGYAVDLEVMRRGTDFLRNFMRRDYDLCEPNEYNCDPSKRKNTAWADGRAYFLFVMSELGNADLGLTLNLWDDEKLLSTFGRVTMLMIVNNHLDEIAASNATTAKLERIKKELLQHLEGRARIDPRGTYIKPDGYNGRFWMTDTKVTAHTLQAFTRTDPNHPLIPRMITWLIKSRHDGHWETTNDTASALIALTEYLVASKEAEADYVGTILLNNAPSQSFEVNTETITKTHGFTYPLSTLRRTDEANDFVFKKDGPGKLYYEMLLQYYLPIENIAPRSEGIAIEREYYRLDDTKMEHPVREARVGETLVGKLTLALGEERNFVAVESPLPAGFELVNFNLSTSDQTLQQFEGSGYEREERAGRYPSCWCGGGYWEHKELRDDRLFLFGNNMQPGVYEYTYVVQVTTPGQFAHPPAEAHEMYFPENFGRTRGEKFVVRE